MGGIPPGTSCDLGTSLDGVLLSSGPPGEGRALFTRGVFGTGLTFGQLAVL